MDPGDSPINDARLMVTDAGRQSVVVNAPVAEVYERWSHFEDLPKFIEPLRKVQRIDDTHFLFSSIHDGSERQNILHVVLRVPGRRIAWRTLSGSFWLAVVTFEPYSNQATEITLKMSSDVELFTMSQRLREYLVNFKRLIESQPSETVEVGPRSGALVPAKSVCENLDT